MSHNCARACPCLVWLNVTELIMSGLTCRWAADAAGDPLVFPYPANAIKVAELGAPGSYQTGVLTSTHPDLSTNAPATPLPNTRALAMD